MSALAVRQAVREHLAGTVLVACSGGADSLALLVAAVAERGAARVVGVVVDHGLQAGSAAHTARVVDQMAALGVDETASIRVTVDPGHRGVEAGAREARYAALGQLARHFAADVVLLGHTLDDQAETVLLGLTRGSGGRSIAGMRPAHDRDGVTFVRPLLDVTRAETEAACREQDLTWWEDPHNADRRFVRSRIRHEVVPTLERELGPGVAAALARTAQSVREDVDALDDMAEAWLAASVGEVRVDGLRGLPPALGHRVVRLAALAAGALPGELTRAHVLAVASLADGPGGRLIRLPGHLTAFREDGVLRFGATPPTG
ncbi:tRNA lysidine(34) synthetase TilS [Nocardioides aequoreus]|uniref:tRNA lysidine(34) synthetase TilS n=1 Tax=Nocardioides aequoreus TaxID=397278 RepID=UPI0004C3F242|nr:tRNA lysidine(34) synthetase TilS [Nocardioides aequoreus]